MAPFFIYILKWAISLALLYSLYGLFLRKETFHTFNRTVLLSILILSMVMPFCVFTTSHETFTSSGFSQIETAISSSSLLAEDKTVSVAVYPEISVTPKAETSLLHLNYARIILFIYALGLIFFWLRYAVSLFSLARIIARCSKCKDSRLPNYATLLINNKVQIPFSWFSCIVMNDNDLKGPSSIIVHELTHVRRHHSLDMLLCDFVSNMLWFLPFSWMLRHDMCDVHEYEADQAVMLSGANPTEYQMLLINNSTGSGLQPLANGFNQHSIKKRLVMMYKKQSSKMARLKVLYILPLAGIALAAFARPAIINDVSEVLKAEETKAPLLLPSEIVSNPTQPLTEVQIVESLPSEEHSETASLEGAEADPVVLKVTVKEKGGDYLSYANVIITDKDNRIIANGVTDSHGVAQVKIPKGGETLQVSYIGFETFERKVGHLEKVDGTAYIVVDLAPSIKIQTLMVIGYPVPVDTAAATPTPSKAESAKKETDSMDDTEFEIVESMPEWEGGTMAMTNYISNEIKYPELACVYREEANVTVEFVIDKNGNQLATKVSDIEDRTPLPQSTYDKAKDGDLYAQERIIAHEDVLDQFKAEAKRVVRTLAGKWTPGTQRGNPVNCKLRIPISFVMATRVSH